MLYNLLFLLAVLFLNQNVSASEIKINSIPDKAEIKVMSPSEEDQVSAGVTPLAQPLKAFTSQFAKGKEVVLVEISKNGYRPVRIIIPLLLKSDFNLTVTLKEADFSLEMRQIDALVDQVLTAQRMIRGKDYDKALVKLQEIEAKFPRLSSPKEMQGAVYYLKKDFQKALLNYQEAYGINSENMDSLQMVRYLEKSLGIKKMHSSGGAP